MTNEKISLFCNEGGSDKEYHLQLEAKGDGYVVNYQNGKRGSALQSGTRTSSPVSYEKAKALYDSVVKAKLAGKDGKRYRRAANDSNGYTSPTLPDKFTGVLPQLLNAIPEGQEGPYLDDPDWVMQQKFDGHRRLVRIGNTSDSIIGINRKGEAIGIPPSAAEAFAALRVPSLVLDGEAIGDRLHVFDLLEYAGTNIRNWGFIRRFEQLRELLAALPSSSPVEIVPIYKSSQEKRRMFERLRASGAEGVTFKVALDRYVPGRPSSGGSAMKFKFWHEASVLVEQVNAGKRSVSVSVLSPQGDRVDIGSVTIPPDQDIPNAGAILEVRYLYAFHGGSLYQTTSKGVRDDIEPSECTQDQLVYKRAEVVDEEMSPVPM